LDRVRELVRDQFESWRALWSVALRTEHDVAPNRERPRIHGARRFRSAAVGVHAHVSEIAVEAIFHQGTSFPIERLPASADPPNDERRHIGMFRSFVGLF
jgi:ethanolamine utilization protein EutA (predicted chaperonin)